MSPALVAQIVLLLSEVTKLGALLGEEDLTPAQKQAIKDAVRRANEFWERA